MHQVPLEPQITNVGTQGIFQHMVRFSHPNCAFIFIFLVLLLKKKCPPLRFNFMAI